MNLKVLALSGLGVLGVGAAGAVGIAASSGGGEKESEENATPTPIPTISQKLSDIGYTYNPPKLSDRGKLVQSCTENLLRKTGLDNSKLYGCGIAKMDLWDSGDQFENQTVDYLNFASEIFIRKGDEGWRINTRIDNSSSNLIYQHLLTHYKKRSGKDLEIEGIFLIDVGDGYNHSKEPRSVPFPGKSRVSGFVTGIATIDKKLNIKLPVPEGQWYQGDNYLVMKPTALNPTDLKKVHRKNKTWSGIWMDNSSADKSWMFKDINVFVGDMTYSQVFCEGSSCGAGTNTLYKLNRSQGSSVAPSFWWEASSKLLSAGAETSIGTSEARQSILGFVGDSKGEWVDANIFCKSGSESETKISDEELEKLKIYCSKLKA